MEFYQGGYKLKIFAGAKLFISLFISLAVGGLFVDSPAFAIVPGKPQSMSNRDLCAWIIKSGELSEAVPIHGAPGLYILHSELHGQQPNFRQLIENPTRTLRQDELEPAAGYARLISALYGESLILLPSYEGRTISGIDALVTNREGEAAYNVSLKRCTLAPWEKKCNPLLPLRLATEAVEKAKKFSNVEAWLESPNSTKISPASLSWFARVARLVGFSESGEYLRKVKVVIDVLDDGEMPEQKDRDTIQSLLNLPENAAVVDAVIFMRGSEILILESSAKLPADK